MALRPRQVRFYTDLARHYRANTTPAANGDTTFSLVVPQIKGRAVAGSYGISTTVTTGANSATQRLGSTTGMLPGMLLYFPGADVERTIASVTDATHVVLTAAVTSVTGETVLEASLMKGKHYTRPNYDTPTGGGGFALTKMSNIFTSDEWHCDLTEAIGAEDYIEMVKSPNVGGLMKPFRVAGEPLCRGGIANVTEAYLTPDLLPRII